MQADGRPVGLVGFGGFHTATPRKMSASYPDNDSFTEGAETNPPKPTKPTAGDDPDTAPVRFTVMALDRVHGSGRLLALAAVSIDLDGIPLTLHGLQVVRQADGKLQCRAPHYRDPSGRWVPAVTLPEELEAAIGAEILAEVLRW